MMRIVSVVAVLLGLALAGNSLTELEKRQEFSEKDFVFDFNEEPMLQNGIGTTLIPAFLNTFPVLQKQGVSTALVNIEPCGGTSELGV
mmetsp:Transcript_24283/g.35027  ORF Transcript_24283/g.35027 Transcript_24283/m.35027 type:complete len:88 (-) Transcript_24283:460-723(-)